MTELLIERLGHRGDGVAHHDGQPVFVPYALPGERVEAEIRGERAEAVTVLAASKTRVEPPCPHFGVCGGCVIQHLADAGVAAFKRELVIEALADRGLSAEVEPTITVPPRARRRGTFAGVMAGRTPLVGFHERASHRVVAIETCFVVTPRLFAILPALRILTGLIQPRKGPLDLTCLETETGIDVAVSPVPATVADRLRVPLIQLAEAHDLARLTVGGEVVVERRPPLVRIDGVAVVPPPGGFLQAAVEAEAAMAEVVLAATAGAKRVADLYSGVGTFAFRLSRHADVLAAESDAAAVASLDRAMRTMTGRHRITPERRDLARRPFVEKELERFDAVVFDPPRAGAPEQSAWLAKSKVPTVVAVSCNPATLARDLRTLVDGGYRIERVVPIDQFRWSAHVEVVAVLRR